MTNDTESNSIIQCDTYKVNPNYKSPDGFEWDDDLIQLFGMYHTKYSGAYMCNCITCFKRRYLVARNKVVRSAFASVSDYNRTVLAAIDF